MANQPANIATVEITVGGGRDLGILISSFKWKSFVNGGYIIYAKFQDPHLSALTDTANKQYLQKARREPLEVKWKLKYVDGRETPYRIAYMTDLDSKTYEGGQDIGIFEFIAVDPPSWYLNNGNAEGKVYKGKVSDVIKQVINEYTKGIESDIGTTTDNKDNLWYMMRLDPKSFIVSLMDWSSSVNNKQTNWIVASTDKKIVIKEQSELKSTDLGTYSINIGVADALSWKMLTNNYLSNLQTVISTGGISATTGLYLDSKNSITKDKVVIKDENTSNKKNVKIQEDQGFSKPTDEKQGWTFIQAIPEDSAGLVGKKYSDYIDGRCRSKFLNMLNLVMRMQVTINGNEKIHDSSELGVSTVNLLFEDIKNEPYILSGKWLVYGFEHKYSRQLRWTTTLFLARHDYNDNSQKV